MNNKKLMKGLLPAAVSLAMIGQAQAAITLYDQDETTFSTDGFFNTFYVTSDTETATSDVSQSRVKMGFLPNYIGFNFSKNVDGLKLGGRSSFWVSINDSDLNRNIGGNTVDSDNNPGASHGAGTHSLIDVRQFYATIGGDFGEILIGKDFTLFNRTNIFKDQILMGYGQSITTTDDGGNVSFGNIASGYLYPMPTGQITYRSPNMGGLNIAIGLIDPTKSNSASEESSPRIEGEVTFGNEFDGGSYTVWVGGMSQSSEQPGGGGKVDSSGFSYGASISMAGLSLTASGFTAEGIGFAGLGNATLSDVTDVDGYLIQGAYTIGSTRLVASYGENEGDVFAAGDGWADMESTTFAVFHSVNANFTLVGEYTTSEGKDLANVNTETDTIALGAVVTF